MYFEFDDSRPDITPVGSVISWREGVLLSLVIHLVTVIVALNSPGLFTTKIDPSRAQQVALGEPRQSERFVFVQPRVDKIAPAPPKRAEASDENRVARSVERPKDPTNELPLSRGNTPERVEQQAQETARGQGQVPEPEVAEQARAEPPSSPPDSQRFPESSSSLQLPMPVPKRETGVRGPHATPGGSLGDALRNLQRYVQGDQFENPQGGGGAFGPEIQFDTKGVEFGPWVRRFVAQVKRNWLIPYAAMTSSGRVVVTFNVHKNGAITDLTVIGPSPVGAFNTAAYGALAASNPTTPLPPEYPSDKAFFTVTFFYNEDPQ